jgi:hypothetical protein
MFPHGTPTAYDAARYSRKPAARNPQKRSPRRTTCFDFTTSPDEHGTIQMPTTKPITEVNTPHRVALVPAGEGRPRIEPLDNPRL